MESCRNDRRFRDLLGRGGGMAFPTGNARQDVFNILTLFGRGHEKDCFDSLKECEPLREIEENRPIASADYKTWNQTKK